LHNRRRNRREIAVCAGKNMPNGGLTLPGNLPFGSAP
jgi:hypothetical protein